MYKQISRCPSRNSKWGEKSRVLFSISAKSTPNLQRIIEKLKGIMNANAFSNNTYSCQILHPIGMDEDRFLVNLPQQAMGYTALLLLNLHHAECYLTTLKEASLFRGVFVIAKVGTNFAIP
jgi:hypothetical protein